MRVCLICTEIFAWNKYGGFGKATRMIGRELAKRGIEVCAVVPRRTNQKPVEILDNITVFSFPMNNPLKSIELFRKCDADVYHSEEPSLNTYFALKAMPGKQHLVTSRDPKFLTDWISEFIHPSHNKFQVLANFLYENNFLVRRSVRKVNNVSGSALFLMNRIKKKYLLKNEVGFLPSPIEIPDYPVKKSEVPTVCYLARWDKRKRPELFFELVKSIPEVKFIAVGKGRNKKYDDYLRNKYSSLENLTITGFINQFESDKISRILEKSWILVNTAAREGLPNSFLEALAHKCSILSSVNPENITEKYGCIVKDKNFQAGLKKLLENNSWKEKGERGQEYVTEHYELNKAIKMHIETYNSLLGSKTAQTNILISTT
jgi:glycosyltransferase involved in cell wall biosynthesis